MKYGVLRTILTFGGQANKLNSYNQKQRHIGLKVLYFLVFLILNPFIYDFLGSFEARVELCDCGQQGERSVPSREGNLISYSLYGNISDEGIRVRYYSQLGERAQEIQTLYPGFKMRVYHDLSFPQFEEEMGKLCQIRCQFSDLVELIDVRENVVSDIGELKTLQPNGKVWRFSAMLDDNVNVILFRDLDSRVMQREVDAVKEWLDEPEQTTFHILRDHPSHNGYMMAGLWGVRMSRRRKFLKTIATAMLTSATRTYWDFDQALLRRHVWPVAKNDVTQHDSYFCRFSKFKHLKKACKPFPTQRKEKLYVGWGRVKGSPNNTGITKCPRQCRPQAHQDWLYC